MYVEITPDVISDFRRMFPAFQDCISWPDMSIEMLMTEADAWTAGSAWGPYRLDDDRNFKKRGMYYLTAHFLSSFYGNDASDPTAVQPEARLNISGKSVGDESITYRITAMESTTDDFLSTTIYGVMFVSLRKRVATVPVAV